MQVVMQYPKAGPKNVGTSTIVQTAQVEYTHTNTHMDIPHVFSHNKIYINSLCLKESKIRLQLVVHEVRK